MFSFFNQHRRKRLRSQPSSPALFDIIEHDVPIHDHLPQAEQRELHGHIQVFLADKLFERCVELELTEEITLTIAAQACLLVLHRETDYFARLITIPIRICISPRALNRSVAELL